MEDTENNGDIRDTRGRFGPGNMGKPKGSASNASARVKTAIQKFLEDNIDQVQDSFDKLKPIEKLQFIANILPYAVPKLSSVQTENETHINGGITISWEEPPVQNPPDKGSNGIVQSI